MTLRADATYARDLAIVGQYWRDLGIQVAEVAVPDAAEREFRATFPAFEETANNRREGVLVKFISSEHATVQNRYAGNNTSHYSNPRVDELFGTLTRTPDQRAQLPLLRELGEILATDLPLFPSYFSVTQAAVRAGTRALVDDFAGSDDIGTAARNAHLWDRG